MGAKVKMKALSIKQPWAWAILHGKPVENRTWPTRFGGPFLIHASKTFDHEGYRWLVDLQYLAQEYSKPVFGGNLLPARDDFKMGGIIGKAKIVDCVNYYDSVYFSGPWGFVIKDAEPLPFFPCKGQLGFFEVNYPSETKKGER